MSDDFQDPELGRQIVDAVFTLDDPAVSECTDRLAEEWARQSNLQVDAADC